MNGLKREVSRVTHALKATRVREKSFEGYALKDTPVNVLQRKDTPVSGLQRKFDLSPSRSRERNIVLLRFFCRRKEILLTSCTNYFSSLYEPTA